MLTQLEAVTATPSIEVSRAVQTARLPRDDNGNLLPLTCSLSCFKVFGPGVYAYMVWQRFMMMTFGIAFAFVMPNMSHNAFGDRLLNPTWLNIHSLGNISEVNISYAIVELLVSITFLLALRRGKQLLDHAEKDVKAEESQSGNVEETVWLRGLPSDTTMDRLKKLMQSYGKCVHVVLAHANRELLIRIRQRTPLLETLHYRQALLHLAKHHKATSPERVAHLADKVLAARTALQEHDAATAKMTRRDWPITGDAFVTFATREDAKACLDSVGTSKPVLRGANQTLSSVFASQRDGEALALPAGVWAQPAPAPSDILWEGLSTSERERFWRQVGSTALTLLISCIGTAIITFVTFAQGTAMHAQLITAPEGILGLLYTAVEALVLALPCIFGNVILFATTPLFADLFERHVTFSDKEATIFRKLVFFQVFNTTISCLSFLPFVCDWLLGRRWYTLGAPVIATILGPLGDCIFIPSLLDWMTINMPFQRYVFAPRQKTQLGMDRLFVKESDLYLAFRVQLACKFVILCLMFGSAMPILYLFATIFFAFGSIIDRHNLLRNQTPPARTSGKLTRRAHQQIFPIAIVLHTVMTPIFFHHLTLEEDRGQITPPPPAPPPFPLAPALAPDASPPSPQAPAPSESAMQRLSVISAFYASVALLVLTVIALVALKWWERDSNRTFVRVHTEELLVEMSSMLKGKRKGPLDQRVVMTPRGNSNSDGPLRVPALRPQTIAKESYIPPRMSATLLSKFAEKHDGAPQRRSSALLRAATATRLIRSGTTSILRPNQETVLPAAEG